MKKIDKFLRNKIHWAVLIGTVIAGLTYYDIKPRIKECNQPAPVAQIAQTVAEQV